MQKFYAEICSYKILSLTLNVNFENVFLQKNLNSKLNYRPFLMKNFENDHFILIINFNLQKITFFTSRVKNQWNKISNEIIEAKTVNCLKV